MNPRLKLCVIAPAEKRLRVYQRNVHGKVWVVAEYEIEDWDAVQINSDIEVARAGGRLWKPAPEGRV